MRWSKSCRRRCRQAAENLNFEEAARFRDRIQAVERILEKQRIITTEGEGDQDVIALASGDDETCAQVFFFRSGKLVGREYFILQGTRESSAGEVMSSFLQQFYESSPHVPAEIIVEAEPDERVLLQNWLKEKRKATTASSGSSTVTITAPKRGDKVRLVEMVKQNAREVLEQQRIKWLTDSQKTQLALEETPGSTQPGRCHHNVSNATISLTHRGPIQSEQWSYLKAGDLKIANTAASKSRQVEGPNDYASHQEVLRRRFRRASSTSIPATPEDDISTPIGETVEELLQEQASKEQPTEVEESTVDNAETQTESQMHHEWNLPDLVIIDGGRGQLNAALQVMHELQLDIPTIGVAKEQGSHTKLDTAEEIYVPGSPEPIILARNSQGTLHATAYPRRGAPL